MKRSIEGGSGAPLIFFPGKMIIPALSVLVIVTFLAFSPVLKCGFINWDDDAYVTGNHMIKDLSPHNVRQIFTSTLYGMYTPLVMLSFALEHHFYRLNPFPYHAHNLLLHIVNSLLVFWLVRLISGDPLASLAAAFLFALSPLRVQSVAWVVERKGLLCAFFFLSSFICYCYYGKRPSLALYFVSLLLYAFSLLSKPIGSLLPFALILYDYYILERLDRKALMMKAPYLLGFLAAGVAAWIHVYFESHLAELYHISFFKGIFIAAYLFLMYALKIVIPFDLQELYPLEASFIESPPLAVWLSPLVIVVIATLLAKPLKRLRSSSPALYRHGLFGILFFTLFIFPVLRLLPADATSLIGLRQTYIPSIGIVLILGEAFSWCWRSAKRSAGKALCMLLLVLLAGYYGLSSYCHCAVWKDGLTFWNHVLEKHPRYLIALNGRANFFKERGEYLKAREDLEKAFSISPFDGITRINLAGVLIALDDYRAAKGHLDFMIAFEPKKSVLYYYRGNIYQREKDYGKAEEMYRKAIAIDSSYIEPYINLGNIYFEQGAREKAIEEFNRALSINRKSSEAYYNRGNAHFREKRYSDALGDYDKAVAFRKNYWDAYRNRALASFMMKDYQASGRDVKLLLEAGQKVDPLFLLLLDKARRAP
ncbi:MAG: tetratricopeptide repeat protein [Candidatus Eremiobacteraeota bacterium]|nr:tetratricopeptide repeat protein [Candidatus Eremiobacteraeota bacterium]